MTTAPPGWYPEPADSPTPRLRWWDGTQWSEHVAHAHPAAAPAAPTTPDGVELASWGRRLGAWAIDGAIVGVVAQVVQIPLAVWFFRSMTRLADAADPVTGEVPAPVVEDFFVDALQLVAVSLAVTIVLSLVYHAVCLKRWAATPGKRILDLRVRRWDSDGPLGWGTALARPAVQFGLFGLLSFLFVQLLDGLWPLWDERRQSLHDKVVRTVVVTAGAR